MSLSVDKNLSAGMRDGVTLMTDVYRPADGNPVPAIVMRLPYNKEQPVLLFLSGDILRIAQAGYAVVVQDCRGTFQSEGEFSPYFQEAADGADTVAWAAAQPWCSGVVGMMGASYYGATQWLAAGETPPALRAIAPFITTDQYYEKWTYQGGAFQLGFMLQWATATFGVGEVVRRLGRGTASGASLGDALAAADQVSARYSHLPLTDHRELLALTPYYQDWLAHPDYDAYWQAAAPRERYAQITAPALNFGGWYDLFLGGTLANYTGMKANGGSAAARQHQRLVIGPWVHGYNGGVYPERNFGMLAHDGVADVTGMQIRWFDHWLKGIDNGVPADKPVKLFVMGVDQWRDEADWPLPDTRFEPWYLHSNGHANTAVGDGRLSTTAPGHEPVDHYRYDPHDPVPTVGGASFLPGLFIAANAGPRDQTIVEARADVLCYTSEPLARDTEVTGPISLVIYVNSSAVDTDFTGKLVEVYPDGRALILTDGILRARYRDSLSAPALLIPGETYKLTLDLVATANVFKAGNRLRLEVSSSNFPRFDRNANHGGVQAEAVAADFITASNSVLHDVAHPSHLLLPMIERG
ncbi:MAG: CocE/NonD family hydrolase [Gammaproteobacteria bacterium]|nr:CocE/NonD family hydrolase [Gammaproteobacteria bacterium]